MATASVLTSGGTGTDASSFSTASITPNKNKIVLVCIYINETSGTPPLPTLSGNGMTWTEVATTTSGTVRGIVFRGVSSSPSAGAITIDFGGNSQNDCEWIVVELTGLDIRGTNGANAIVQSATGTVNGTSLSITLSAFSGSLNPTFGFVCSRNGPSELVTPGSGFIELANVTSPHNAQAQWKNSNDTTVDWSFGQSLNDCCGIALELRASPEGGAAILFFL